MDAVDEAKPVKKAAKPKKKVFLGPFYIYFPFNGDNPVDPFNEEIFSLIIYSKESQRQKLHIVGHTDRAGSTNTTWIFPNVARSM